MGYQAYPENSDLMNYFYLMEKENQPSTIIPKYFAHLGENAKLFAAIFCASIAFTAIALIRIMNPGELGGESFCKLLALSAGWVPALGVSLWLIWRPARPLGLLLFFCAAASDWFEIAHLSVFGAKLYYFDLLIGAAFFGAAIRAAAGWRTSQLHIPL